MCNRLRESGLYNLYDDSAFCYVTEISAVGVFGLGLGLALAVRPAGLVPCQGTFALLRIPHTWAGISKDGRSGAWPGAALVLSPDPGWRRARREGQDRLARRLARVILNR